MMTRRQAIQKTILATAALTAGSVVARQQTMTPAMTPSAAPTGPFKLPELPYTYDALEPHIDAQTMHIHHDKHHAAYVANLNKAVAGHPDLASKPVEELVRNLDTLPEAVRTAIRNNGGGHLNHSEFWLMMKKDGGGEPKGELAAAIAKDFGSFDKFKGDFTAAALKVFGSGWAWLTSDGKTLKVEITPNQDSVVTAGRVPLLGIDVWEHAYYLKYQNMRASYITAFYNVIDWDHVAQKFKG